MSVARFKSCFNDSAMAFPSSIWAVIKRSGQSKEAMVSC
jgi:hypothetical protein